jgi:hypothetical protein
MQQFYINFKSSALFYNETLYMYAFQCIKWNIVGGVTLQILNLHDS